MNTTSKFTPASLYSLTPAQAASFGKILLTGASGRLGKPVLERLSSLGLSVRALSPDKPPEHPGVEWVEKDFKKDINFDREMEGITHVVHLGAELWKVEPMEQVNVAATEALALAAEKAGVRSFLYTSSICAYGSTKDQCVTEDSELIPTEGATRRNYMEMDFLIDYGVSKLKGEVVIRKHASKCNYVIFRPTEIAWEKDYLKPASWGLRKRIWRGNRHTHQIYYRDVVNAIIYFLLRSVEPSAAPRGIETFNLSNDDAPGAHFVDFLRMAWKTTGNPRFKTPFAAPLWLEYIKDHFKWKVWEHRYPLGLTYVDPSRLYSTGYRHEFGLEKAREAALKLFAQDPDKYLNAKYSETEPQST